MLLRTGQRVYINSYISIALLAGIITGLLALSAPVLLRRATFMADVHNMAARALSSAISLPVTVDRVDIVVGGNLRLSGVSIENKNGAAQFHAGTSTVDVDLSLWRLLWRRDVAAAIKHIVINDLELSVDGALSDLPGLLPYTSSTQPVGLPFPVTIKGVTLRWQGWQVHERQISLAAVNKTSVAVTIADMQLNGPGWPTGWRLAGRAVVGDSGATGVALQMHTPDGSARANGAFSWGRQGEWDMRFSSPKWQIPFTYGLVTNAPVTVSGRLQGPFLNPTLAATVSQGRSVFRGNVNWRAPFVVVSSGMARITTGNYNISGWYNTKLRTMDATVEAEQLPAAEAMAWVNLKWPITGDFTGKMHLYGTVAQPIFKLDAEMAEGEAWKQTVDDMRLQLNYSNGVTSLQSFTAEVAGGRLTGQGHMQSGKLNLVFHGVKLAAGSVLTGATRWFSKPSYTPTFNTLQQLSPVGSISAEVSVAGTSAHPRIAADLTLPSVRLAGVAAGNWHTRLVSLPGQAGTALYNWDVEQLQVDMVKGSLQGKGTLRFGSSSSGHQLAGTIEKFSLGQILDLADAISNALGHDGKLAAVKDLPAEVRSGSSAGKWALELGGAAKRSNLTVDATMNANMYGMSVGLLLKGNGWDTGFNINEAKLTAAGGVVKGAGKYTAGAWRATGTWQDLPATLLAHLFRLPQTVSGKLQGDISAAYDAENGLSGQLSWQSAAVTVATGTITAISGEMSASQHRLQMQNWRGTAAGRQISLNGAIPLPTVLAGRKAPQAAPIDLTLEVPDGPLGTLAVWMPLLPSLRAGGEYLESMTGSGRIKLHVGGQLGALAIYGTAALAKVQITLPQPWGEISQLEMGAAFDGTTISLVNAAGQALGGKWQASGTLRLRPGLSPLMQAKLTGRNLQPTIAGISGEGDVDLQLSGALSAPQLSGKVVARRGDIDLLRMPAGNSGGAVSFAPRLNLDVEASRVRLRAGALLDTYLAGMVKVTGTSKKPALSGQLTAERGHLNYLGTNFTIDEAKAVFDPYRGLWPNLNVQATAWSGRYVFNLQMVGMYPDLQAHLRSDPPLPEGEILALLAWPEQMGKLSADGSGTIGQSLVEILQGSLQAGLVSGVETSLRNSLGLDELELKPDFVERSLRIEAGKYIAPRLYLSYGRTLFQQPDDELNLEYQFDDGWKLTGGLDKNGDVSVGLELKTKF